MPLAFLLIMLSAAGLAAAGKGEPKRLMECPGKITYVLVEQGDYDPPAYTEPDWDNRREGAQFYGEWNYIHNQSDSVAHCHYEEAGMGDEVAPKVIDVKIPAEATKCVHFENTFSCQ